MYIFPVKSAIFTKCTSRLISCMSILSTMKTIAFLVAAMSFIALAAVLTPDFAYSEKNPQAECIKGQNQVFIGNEQKGDAYENAKDSCQILSR